MSALRWWTPKGHHAAWTMCRFGQFGLRVCLTEMRPMAEVVVYRRKDSEESDFYSGPSTVLSATGDAGRREAVKWARSIGLAVPS